jgi:hypothetical protein
VTGKRTSKTFVVSSSSATGGGVAAGCCAFTTAVRNNEKTNIFSENKLSDLNIKICLLTNFFDALARHPVALMRSESIAKIDL